MTSCIAGNRAAPTVGTVNNCANFTAMRRFERGDCPWGLYSVRENRWLDMVFATRRDAEAAEAILVQAAKRRN